MYFGILEIMPGTQTTIAELDALAKSFNPAWYAQEVAQIVPPVQPSGIPNDPGASPQIGGGFGRVTVEVRTGSGSLIVSDYDPTPCAAQLMALLGR